MALLPTSQQGKNTTAMQVLEDCAAGDDSDFKNSQDVLDYG